MIVGAFLAESASAVDNKLTVSGGVLSRFALGPDRFARFLLVVLTQTETGTSDRRVSVVIHSPSGEQAEELDFQLPEAAVTAEVGFAIFGIEATLPVDGRWVLLVTGGAGVISLPLIVSA
ncbi:hypothetical protein [Mycobacterium sp. 1423905.2]|uniref:hypothetical protein n=1 Tax=Mycobacterium sp. 1423905.2 TaxID=1856859 RepID=UPI000801FF0E|nr:hypothetical protein [Mycobacterium sp. 1423905.2]OBJ61764.1 hypothetical protein A9W95_08855 [Mycobacterium sp. 1423905.2]